MVGDHLTRVHAIDVVGPEDAHVVGVLVADKVQVLVDSVRGAGEPVGPQPHLGGHRGHVVAEQV